MNLPHNLLLNTDSYKHSHFLQYPPRSQTVYSYIESRGGEYDKLVFFGLQMFIKEYLEPGFSQADIDEAELVCKAHGVPFNKEGWEYILEKHDGQLPIEIDAVPEGTVVPTSHVLVSIHNTDPAVPWLTSFVETMLLRAVWYPTTVCTVSWRIKQAIKKYLEATGDPALIGFKLHDFGARGVSSNESAGIGGCAHLVNFMGTDTMEALRYARAYYGEAMAGFSIPAAEHSTITSWGEEHEKDAYRNMVKQFAGEGKIYAVVSDSYDIYNAVDKLWGGELKQEVLKSGGTVVIRPDSGDPATIVLQVARLVDKHFGFKLNVKGYKVLHPAVRIIQGDGINEESIVKILETLTGAGYSADNIAFGMGGALLQHMNRDTSKFAMKASCIEVDYHYRDVFKRPKSDLSKSSKRGILSLVKDDFGNFNTVNILRGGIPKGYDEITRPVFLDGKLLVDDTLATIRERSNA